MLYPVPDWVYQMLEWGCMAGAAVAFLYKVPALLRNRKEPVLIALSVYFFCSFLSFFIGLDSIAPHIASAVGYKNITTILIHAIVVVLTAAQQVVLMYWAYSGAEAWSRSRNRIVAFGVALAILILLFVWALPTSRNGSESVSLLNLGNTRYSVYLCLYIAVVAAGQVPALHLSVRYAKMVSRPWTSRGMWTVAAGAAFIMIYCGMRWAEIVGVTVFHADMTPWDPVQWISGDIGSLLELIGWTIPGWGPAVFDVGGVVWAYNTHRRLRPLWVHLYAANPDIAMDPPRSRLADFLRIRGIERQLYRRVIEIRDGQAALRPFLDSAASDAAVRKAEQSGLAGDELLAATEALKIHAARRGRTQNPPPDGGASITSRSFPDADLMAEARWLTRVADHFGRFSPPEGAAGPSARPHARRS